MFVFRFCSTRPYDPLKAFTELFFHFLFNFSKCLADRSYIKLYKTYAYTDNIRLSTSGKKNCAFYCHSIIKIYTLYIYTNTHTHTNVCIYVRCICIGVRVRVFR